MAMVKVKNSTEGRRKMENRDRKEKKVLRRRKNNKVKKREEEIREFIK